MKNYAKVGGKKVKIISSPKCLEYEAPGHPESPTRVASATRFLKDKGFEFIEPQPAAEKDVLAVHERSFLEQVKTGNFSDIDTPSFPNIYSHALLSAGAAAQAAEMALAGRNTFSLMRPPGHHAGKNFLGGFCYFNNIAIGVAKILEKVKRVAIIDIDCHHGNGTQDIFLGSKVVLYTSLHQGHIFPGTGLKSKGNCLNYPLEAGIGPKEYLAVFEKALKEVQEFNPALVAISAGFDTYKGDPLTNINLEKETYLTIGQMITDLNKPHFSVLEGGYSQDLGECIYNFLEGLSKQKDLKI